MTNRTFAELDLAPELLAAVAEMGFTGTTDIQAEAIPAIRTGADVLARSQTGTGKTVAFGIPAVERVDPADGRAQVLVLSPTRELAHQCGDELRKLSRHLPRVRTADVCGGGDYRSQFRELQSANVIVGTPGRVMDHLRRGTLDLSRVKLVVLDEADEMLNMGFREDIEVILRDAPAERQIALFSATLPEEILTIAERFQRDPVRIDVNREQIALENIRQLYVEVPPRQKVEALTLLLRYYQPKRAILFANTKSMVDELTEALSAAGFSVEGLHGDMKQLQRTTVMNGFKKGRVALLAATDVAARGIDVSDIDYVVNFDIPKEADAYVHRIGRTGRAGRDGAALTLCCGRQQVLQLKRLCQRSKSEIAAVSLPTAAEIQRADRERTLAFLEKALETPPLPAHEALVEQLVEQGHAPERVAAALLGLYAETHARKLTEVSVPVRAQNKQARERRAMSGVVLSIGSANRVSEKHIIGAVTERSGLSSHDLGKVEIAPEFSTVSVPEEALADVVASMRGCKICGKPVRVMVLEPGAARGRRNAGRKGARRAG